jgi:hypothetical protein
VIDNFLRRPDSAAEWFADAVRVIGLVSVLVAGLGWSPVDAGIIAFVLPALLLPRFLAARAWFDICCGVVILVAAWSNVAGLYDAVAWWDLLLHFLCTGVIAAMLYLMLGMLRVVPLAPSAPGTARTPILLVTCLGLALSSVWEMVEWVGHTFISADIYVSYQDTIGDMVLGGLGALSAGVVVAFVPLLREGGA